MIITATPYRVSLFGGGTDYPNWYEQNGGMVIGMAINKYCYVGVGPTPPGTNANYRVVYSKVEDKAHIKDIEHPAVRGLLQYMRIDFPVEIRHFGDLPSGGGIGASSSYVVGLLSALTLLLKQPRQPKELLASTATHIEQNVIKETVGDQDQIFAAMGGIRQINFNTRDSVLPKMTTHELRISPGRLFDLERALVLVHTGIARFAHEMATKVVDAIPDNSTTLLDFMEIAKEGKRVLHHDELPLEHIATLLDFMWQRKRKFCSDITNAPIDELYAQGKYHGALGGKLCGAGGGGFFLFFVPPVKRETFIAKMGRRRCVTFRCDVYGSRVLVDN